MAAATTTSTTPHGPPADTEQPKRVPTKIKQTIRYYPWQVEGVRWMARRSSFILGDDQGLGKTIQALTVAALDFDAGIASRVLVVCDAGLKYNWAYDEISDLTEFTWMVLDGSPDQRLEQLGEYEQGDTDILIVNYEQVVAHWRDLNEIGFDIVMVDECQEIKNQTAKKTKAVHQLRPSRWILMSGTVLENRPDELWSPLRLVDPNTPKYWPWVQRHCNTPEAPVWMADGSFRPIGEIEPGEQVMGWRTESEGRKRPFRARVASTVEEVRRRTAPMILRCTMEDGSVIRCTPDHHWLSYNNPGGMDDLFVKVKHGPTRLGTLSKVVDVPERLEDMDPVKRDQIMWLMGMLDGEGTALRIGQSRSANPDICDRIAVVLDRLEIPHRYEAKSNVFVMTGGIGTRTKLLAWGQGVSAKNHMRLLAEVRFDLPTPDNGSPEGKMMRIRNRVVHVEEEGPGEVVAMQTTTGNYIAWGHASKNCLFGGFGGKQIVGVKKRAELKAYLGDVMLRRIKADTLKLPEKEFTKIEVELSPLQRQLYDEVMDELQLTLPSDPTPMELESGLTRTLRLRQICSTPANLGFEDESSKLDGVVAEYLKLAEQGHKCVFFTQFRETLACLERRIQVHDLPVWTIKGGVAPKERKLRERAWRATSEPGAFAATFQTAGRGLTLVAARHCFMVDKLYVPGKMSQAEDRLHRIGQSMTEPVQIFEAIAAGTYEERIEKILHDKGAMIDSLIPNSGWKAKLYQAILDDGKVPA